MTIPDHNTESRDARQLQGLQDDAWHRLRDQELLDLTDLQESIEQMKRAEGKRLN